jgi:hypothetical protein
MKVRGWSCGAFVARRNSISPLLTFQKRGLPEVITVALNHLLQNSADMSLESLLRFQPSWHFQRS